jgi:hypothetical protein
VRSFYPQILQLFLYCVEIAFLTNAINKPMRHGVSSVAASLLLFVRSPLEILFVEFLTNETHASCI